MITHNASPMPPTKDGKKDRLASYDEMMKLKIQGDTMFSTRRLWRWLGILLTLAWGAAALTRDIFNLPVNMRPWVFVTFIFWFISFCAGVFNS